MIERITVINENNESIDLVLTNPFASGFLITDIEGLGPGKAVINITESSISDDSAFNSARKTPRNIVLSIKLLEVPTIETARLTSYKFFQLKSKIRIEVETEFRHVYIDGIVESNEPTIFTDDADITVSIICPKPDFISKETIEQTLLGIESLFEFPFSNDSVDTDLIALSDVVENGRTHIQYFGDVSVGVVFNINILNVVGQINIFDVVTRDLLSISSEKIASLTGAGLNNGDRLELSTVRSNPYLKLIRNNVEYNVLNALGKYPIWFQLRRGTNEFAVVVDTGESNIMMSVYYETLYEGV